MSWVNSAEQSLGSMSMLYFVSVLCFLSVVVLLGCCAFVYFGQLYRLAPSWGPVIKYDSDASEDLQIRQYLISRHNSGSRKKSETHVPGLWEIDPGTTMTHPQYGSVVVRDDWDYRQSLRAADPHAPRDEPYYREQQGLTVASGPQMDFYSNVSHQVG